MGIYYDSMTPKEKKTYKKKTRKKELEKKWQKKSVGRAERIYIDGLLEYVSYGCEDNVVLNIVITF